MYEWLVFLHVISVFLFLVAHGAAVVVAFRLGRERDVHHIRTMLDVSSYPWTVMFGALLLILGTGIALGFMGGWWRQGWIWAALVLLIAILVAHQQLGSRYFHGIRRAAGLPWHDGKRDQPAEEPEPDEVVLGLVSPSRAWTLASTGGGGIAIITWLMMFKPF